MKKEELVSVIVPVYNVKKYVKRCIESLMAQTYHNIEIIIVDDGSTDSSYSECKIMMERDSRIKLFHKENGGLSDARNYGIIRSHGQYITCVDSDDYVDDDYIEYLKELIDKYNCSLSIAQHRVHCTNKIIEYGKLGDEKLTSKQCIEKMLYHDTIDTSAWGKLYRRELFDDVKYPIGKCFEDIGTTYKLFLQCDTIAVGYESKYNYIYRSNSIVNCGFNKKKLDLLEMTDSMGDDVIKVFPDLKDAVLRRRVYARISTLNQVMYVDFENKSIVDELLHFIKENGKSVLANRHTPFRDKCAIRMLFLSYNMYKNAWKLYKKV